MIVFSPIRKVAYLMHELQIFENSQFGSLRVTEINGKIYYCGTDVARALGYTKPNNAINQHCRYTLKQGIPHPQNPTKKIEMSFIPEGDVYRLTARSKLPQAVEFESWVFDTVLPSINKNGGYLAGQENMTPAEIVAQGLLVAQKIIDEKAQLLQAQQVELEALKPKADYCDIILNCKDCVTISQVAKDYGFTANHMNKYLHEQGVQYKVNKQWVLYSKHADKGYVESDTTYKEDRYGVSHAYVNTKWTQKGRLFIYDLLKENGILPLVER